MESVCGGVHEPELGGTPRATAPETKPPLGVKRLLILPPNLSPDDLRHCERVRQHGGDAPHCAVRFVKHPKLSKQRSPVVVDLLARQAFFLVEREDTAERKFNLAPGCWQSAPRT